MDWTVFVGPEGPLSGSLWLGALGIALFIGVVVALLRFRDRPPPLRDPVRPAPPVAPLPEILGPGAPDLGPPPPPAVLEPAAHRLVLDEAPGGGGDPDGLDHLAESFTPDTHTEEEER